MRKTLLASFVYLGFFLPTGAWASSFLDLSKAANMGPEESFDEAVAGAQDVQKKNGLKDLPVGSQTLRGVPFQILDPSRNQGRSFVVLKGRRKPSFPEAVSLSAGHLKAPYLYFLHTCRWGGTAQNITVAEYDVVYDDGLVTIIPLRVGVELANFFGAEDTSASSLAWWHRYKNIEMGLNLFAWKNPRPEKSIQSILFKSRSKMPVPILFAITASDKEIPLDAQSPKPEKIFQTDTSTWIPFTPSQASPVGTALDMSFILDASAGKHGKVKAAGDKLVFEDGTPARFWGVQLPDKWWDLGLEKIASFVDRLSVMGCNLVLAQEPSGTATQGKVIPWIWMLDHLKAKGIYVLWKREEITGSGKEAPAPWRDDPAVIPPDLWDLKYQPAGLAARLQEGLLPYLGLPTVLRPENNGLFYLITERVLGSPFLARWVDEWPNEHLSEMPLLFSSTAALQGWTGSIGGQLGEGNGEEPARLSQDFSDKPLFWAQWPIAALAYLRGDLKEGRVYVTTLSAGPPIGTEMVNRLKSLAHRSGIAGNNLTAKTDAAGELKVKVRPTEKSFVSDTGQITWQGNVGVVKVESSRFQALIGFLGHRKFNNATWSVETPNSFASLSAISLSKQPLSNSNHLLFAGVTRMENTGMTFNQSKTKLLSLGTAPLLVEPLSAKVVLYRFQKDSKLKVRALDAQGQTLPAKVPFKWVKNNLVLSWVPSAFYLEVFK